jgi:hypothetical protein
MQLKSILSLPVIATCSVLSLQVLATSNGGGPSSEIPPQGWCANGVWVVQMFASAKANEKVLKVDGWPANKRKSYRVQIDTEPELDIRIEGASFDNGYAQLEADKPGSMVLTKISNQNSYQVRLRFFTETAQASECTEVVKVNFS